LHQEVSELPKLNKEKMILQKWAKYLNGSFAKVKMTTVNKVRGAGCWWLSL
jgi:hypothetical protein